MEQIFLTIESIGSVGWVAVGGFFGVKWYRGYLKDKKTMNGNGNGNLRDTVEFRSELLSSLNDINDGINEVRAQQTRNMGALHTKIDNVNESQAKMEGYIRGRFSQR